MVWNRPVLFPSNSVTSLDYFWTILTTHYRTKVAQIFTNLWAIMKNVTFEEKTALATFGQLLGKIGPLSIPVSGHTALQLNFWQLQEWGQKILLHCRSLKGEEGLVCVCKWIDGLLLIYSCHSRNGDNVKAAAAAEAAEAVMIHGFRPSVHSA